MATAPVGVTTLAEEPCIITEIAGENLSTGSRITGNELFAFFVVEWVTEPDSESRVGLEEDGVEGAVVLEEDPQSLRNSEDGVTMRNVFDHFVVDMLREFHGSLRPAGGADPTAFAAEGYEERVLTAVAVDPCSTMSENATVQVLVKGLHHLVP